MTDHERLLQGDSSCHWVIARLGTDETSRIVARFRNRQDADDSLRMIHRFLARHDSDCRTTFVVCWMSPDEPS